MRSQTLLLLFFGALAILVISGCAPKPDLAAVRLPDLGTDPIGYCNLDSGGRLIGTVTNQGAVDAPASLARVTFTALNTADIVIERATPALAVGSSGELDPIDPADFAASCYNPDCHFTITLDYTNVVQEANEQNNTAEGYCIG